MRRERIAGDDEAGVAKRLCVDPLQGLVAALEAHESKSVCDGDDGAGTSESVRDAVEQSDVEREDATTCEQAPSPLTRASPVAPPALSLFMLMSFIPSRDTFQSQLAEIARTRGALAPVRNHCHHLGTFVATSTS